jgi:hypothetical protein
MKNFTTIAAIAVVALTSACTSSVQTLSIEEAAGPAAVEALAAAKNAEIVAEKAKAALGENEQPK